MCKIKTGFCLFEEKQRMKGLHVLKHYMFSLCTQTCPYRLARLSTSRPKAKRLIVFSRRYAPKNTIRLPPNSGEADTKEERVHSFYMKKNKKY